MVPALRGRSIQVPTVMFVRRKTRLILNVATAFLLLPPFVSSGFALEAALIAGLKKLDPSTRLEQRCDIEAMNRIDKDKTGFRPERVVAGASSDTSVEGDTLKGNGAAFRSKGKWYGLSFVCTTTDDRMDVTAFEYKIGKPIPEAHWEEYGLYE